MASFEDIRRLALALPGVREVDWRGQTFFQVGSKAFALSWEGRTVLKLDKHHQHFLLEVRPETFEKFRVGQIYWSYVALDHLDDAELADLVLEAWSTIVPKKVSKAYLASRA
ncbi:MAG: MmcQ/YjbR family DNA-binding protein [Phenylobacterium sp.]